MQHGAHDVLFHGALCDAVECGDVLLLHVLQPEEYEHIARQLAELAERLQHLRERSLSVENALGRALVDERLLDLASRVVLQRRARDGRICRAA